MGLVDRFKNPRSKLGRWLGARRARTVIVLVYFIVLCVFFGSWLAFALFFPLYWQVYLKEDVTPEWW